MAATIKDIAKKTGLGLATISKYLNGGNVRVENRKAIEEAIKELDFRVNEFARGLKTSKSKTIGVIIPELSNLFCTHIITIIEDILRQKGYAIIVCDCRTNEKLEYEATEFLINKMVDGIISMPVSRDGKYLELPLAKGIPVVLIDRKVEGFSVDAVVVDNVSASENAIDYLIKNGHKNIGIICGPKNVFTSEQRLLGYHQAFLKRGILPKESLAAYGAYTVESGYECLKKLLSENQDMSAVFITNYEMTLGAIIAINELNIKVPDQLSLIGFDNMQLSKVVQPKLTVVSQPIEQIAQHVANIILKRLSCEGTDEAEIVNLSTELMMGASVLRKG